MATNSFYCWLKYLVIAFNAASFLFLEIDMSDIKTIGASWDCESEKTEVYRLLNMIHAMAGNDATNRDSTWSLGATATQDDYTMTEWTNGIVRITAETYKDYDGSVCSHYYQLAKARGE